ncbi:hypothetical protein [Streptomyces sp. NBC_00103]|uniref:hypothetical protein n=1 Tax=Streptomyces sp. NBC_00103 TaxID=2975653 RepID=UPI002255CEE0|nr:hypothetical protein [Streptomyces sp. NBC_00103]MCX5374822.1 hypothetical protein [Streptomyces sp. NBC_00103]
MTEVVAAALGAQVDDRCTVRAGLMAFEIRHDPGVGLAEAATTDPPDPRRGQRRGTVESDGEAGMGRHRLIDAARLRARPN